MKFLLYIFILLNPIAIGFTIQAQINLVPNGSFEEYDTTNLPFNGSFEGVYDWFSSNEGTPDFFSNNSIFSLNNVPNNVFGVVSPFHGDSYVGIFNSNNTQVIYREFIECKLDERLEGNTYYKLSFWCSLGDNSIYTNSLANLTMYFSDSLVFETNQTYINVIDNLPYTKVDDSIKWIKIEYLYLAKGNEQYLIIGNNKEILIDCIPSSSNECNCYTYIDSVSLIKNPNIIIPNVITPNGDGINDFIDFSIYKMGNIYNRWGSIVFKANETNNYIWDGDNLSDGVYFYEINSNYIKQQGYIHLLR